MTDETESKIQDAEIVSVEPAENLPEKVEPKAPRSEAEKPEEKKTEEKPQVVIQHERGVSYYVGFALLTVLAICFFFIPGIALVYLVSCIAALSAPVAWIFAAIISAIVWLIFKLKIKGFKKSFLWYIGLCVLVTLILVIAAVFTDCQVFSGIFSLLIGGSN
jgi:uncharacterized MAPEG superfamily protein